MNPEIGPVGAFCPACGERVRPTDPHVQDGNVRWHLTCTTFQVTPQPPPIQTVDVEERP